MKRIYLDNFFRNLEVMTVYISFYFFLMYNIKCFEYSCGVFLKKNKKNKRFFLSKVCIKFGDIALEEVCTFTIKVDRFNHQVLF